MSLSCKSRTAGVLAACLIMGLAGTPRRAAAGVAVSPLKQEISLKPGETGTARLMLAYNNRLPTDATQTMKLAVMDVQATDEGALTFKDAGVLKNSASRWVALEVDQAVLEPGESRPVECRITVPESAAPGEYYAAVMVTLGTPGKTDKGVLVQYRIASGLFVTVLGRTFPREARIARCEFLWPSSTALEPATQPQDAAADVPPAPAAPESPRVQVLLENTGKARFDGTGKLTVFDERKRIVQVCPMTSRRPCVFAGDSRLFQAEITKALAAGKYTLRVDMDYQSAWAQAHQDLRVEVLPEQAELLAQLRQRQGAAKTLLEATPGNLAAVVPPGASRTLAVTLKNLADTPVACTANVAGTPGATVTVRPEEFTIAQGGKKTLELRVTPAAGGDPGPLSALVNVEASQEGGAHTELTIPVDIQQKTER